MTTARPDLWRDLAATFEAAAAPRLPLDEWAANYRRVIGGPRPGPWNPNNAPMSLEPMRALSDRRVEIVTVVSPAQLMKSEIAIMTAIWMAANGEDVLFHKPDRILLRDFTIGRIRPALHKIGGLVDEPAKLRPDEKKRDSALATQLESGTIRGLSPKLKAGRSLYSTPLVVLDEVGKNVRPDHVHRREVADDGLSAGRVRDRGVDADGGRARNTAREEGTGMSRIDTRER